MPRFKFFPRFRRPSVNEILGITQLKRKISRKTHLSFIRNPATPIKNLQRRAMRRVGYYSGPVKAVRHAGLGSVLSLPFLLVGALMYIASLPFVLIGAIAQLIRSLPRHSLPQPTSSPSALVPGQSPAAQRITESMWLQFARTHPGILLVIGAVFFAAFTCGGYIAIGTLFVSTIKPSAAPALSTEPLEILLPLPTFTATLEATFVPPSPTSTPIIPTQTSQSKTAPAKGSVSPSPTKGLTRSTSPNSTPTMTPLPASPTSSIPSGARIGAICNDGTTSDATGSGAYSQHRGVREWIYQK